MSSGAQAEQRVEVAGVTARRRLKRGVQLSAVGVLALLLGVTVGAQVERRLIGERVMPKVTVWGVDYGGRSPQELKALLEQRRVAWRTRPCTLVVRGRKFAVTPGEVGFDFDVERVAQEVLANGRSGSWWQRWGWRFARLWRAAQVDPGAGFAAEAFARKLSEWQAQAIDDPPQDGKVVYAEEAIAAIAPRAGHVIDEAGSKQVWLSALQSNALPGASIDLPVVKHEPVVSQQALARGVEGAQRLVAGPITLTHESALVEFPAALLGRALHSRVASPDEIALSLDFRVLDEALVSARAALERAAVDARFVVAKDDSISIEPSLTARKISTQEVHTTLWAAAETPERRALLPLTEIDEAKLNTERAQSLGISEKVATFATHFVCCQPRVKNIERMADLLHGTVVLPGETFSVNERVGPRNKASGFVAGPTIVEGEIEDTYGGGVSQFATTLFNAVLNGGYQIIERQAHSYYFPRYPLGHEATLSFPKPDLIFKNDTRYGLLIQARYTGTSIRITLYGNNEGRRIERKLSHAFDFQDPPIDYVPDDTLEPDDEEKVVERGSRGFSVIATRIVTAADGRRQEEARKVVYKPRERVVRVHPCLIPKEDDDHTGDKCPEPEETAEDATQGTGGAPSSPSENE